MNHKRGYFLIDFLFSLVIFGNLFVIATKVLYNINQQGQDSKWLNIDALMTKLEVELKGAYDITMTASSLEYTHGVTRYKFYHDKTSLISEIGPKNRYTVVKWVEDVTAFKLNQLSPTLIEIDLTYNGEARVYYLVLPPK